MKWHPQSVTELFELAEPPNGNAKLASRIYEFAEQLTERRARALAPLNRRTSDIRWWELSGTTVYFQVDLQPMRVLHVCDSSTTHKRVRCAREARARYRVPND